MQRHRVQRKALLHYANAPLPPAKLSLACMLDSGSRGALVYVIHRLPTDLSCVLCPAGSWRSRCTRRPSRGTARAPSTPPTPTSAAQPRARTSTSSVVRPRTPSTWLSPTLWRRRWRTWLPSLAASSSSSTTTATHRCVGILVKPSALERGRLAGVWERLKIQIQEAGVVQGKGGQGMKRQAFRHEGSAEARHEGES